MSLNSSSSSIKTFRQLTAVIIYKFSLTNSVFCSMLFWIRRVIIYNVCVYLNNFKKYSSRSDNFNVVIYFFKLIKTPKFTLKIRSVF